MSKLNTYFGDIHSHCGASYGQGPVEDAIENAKLQLDFVSVTGHALWPDMPREQHGMERRIKYHEDGFARLEGCWDHFEEVSDAANEEGKFVSFLSYEMHSCQTGDQTVLYRDGRGKVLKTETVQELREELEKLNEAGIATMTFTHHIGYHQGYRGINWEEFDNSVSPVVEIHSMHGCSESDYVANPYLHSMGPCDGDSTYSAGLKRGYIVGAIASTDHHSSHPGSHGHGRLSVLAPECTRESIWDALLQRRTVALTGDNVYIDFALNGALMGDVIETPSAEREISFDITAGGSIRAIELLKNEEVIQHIYRPEVTKINPSLKTIKLKLGLEVGWGSRGKLVEWDVNFGVNQGKILNTEPRFKGAEIVSPVETESCYQFSQCEQTDDLNVHFKTRTTGNRTPVTNSNQGFALEVEVPVDGTVSVEMNGHTFTHSVEELVAATRGCSIDGYGTPSYRLTASLPEEYEYSTTIIDDNSGEPLQTGYDVYRLRVEQYNKQWAWSSPIWIKR